jgi:hypothetical protein
MINTLYNGNPLQTDIMVFSRKYKPEPIEPLRLGKMESVFARCVIYFEACLDPFTKLEATPHTKNGEIALLFVGV